MLGGSESLAVGEDEIVESPVILQIEEGLALRAGDMPQRRYRGRVGVSLRPVDRLCGKACRLRRCRAHARAIRDASRERHRAPCSPRDHQALRESARDECTKSLVPYRAATEMAAQMHER